MGLLPNRKHPLNVRSSLSLVLFYKSYTITLSLLIFHQMHHIKRPISNRTSISGRFVMDNRKRKTFLVFSSVTSQVITFLGSFLIGLGDSGYNTQLMNVLASDYKETAGPAFALFRLAQVGIYILSIRNEIFGPLGFISRCYIVLRRSSQY